MADSPALRKAAIVLATLGEDLAAEACSRLPRGQVLRLGEEVARLGWVSPQELQEALADFTTAEAGTRLGGAQYARSLLGATREPGTDEGNPPDVGLTELTVLSQLNDVSTETLYRVLGQEHPQLLAVVVSHLAPALAGRLLGHLGQQEAAEVAYRAAHLAAPAPGVLPALASALARELSEAEDQAESGGGLSLQYVVDLVGALPPGRGKGMLEALSALDQDFGDAVAEQVFTFDDITSLPDADLQVLLRAVDMSLLVIALKGTPPEVRDRVRANLSQRGRERLAEEMDVLGPVPLSQVQEAQRGICAEARALSDRGEISLESGAAEYVE